MKPPKNRSVLSDNYEFTTEQFKTSLYRKVEICYDMGFEYPHTSKRCWEDIKASYDKLFTSCSLITDGFTVGLQVNYDIDSCDESGFIISITLAIKSKANVNGSRFIISKDELEDAEDAKVLEFIERTLTKPLVEWRAKEARRLSSEVWRKKKQQEAREERELNLKPTNRQLKIREYLADPSKAPKKLQAILAKANTNNREEQKTGETNA